MKGCAIAQDGENLVIRPGPSTLVGPVLGLVLLGGADLCALFLFCARPESIPAVPAAELVCYAGLNIALYYSLVLWMRVRARPLLLDRARGCVVDGDQRTKLMGVTAVFLRRVPAGDGADTFQVELAYSDGRLHRLG